MSRAAGAARSRFGPTALACCAGKRFAFPQLRTLTGSNPSAMGPKKKGPHSWEPIKSVVGDEGCRVRLAPPASAAALRALRAALENACAFPQLRTLTGSNPSARCPNKNGPLSRTVIKQVVGDEGCPHAASPPAPASGLRPSRAALENACAFPQLRTLTGSNPSAMGPKKKGPHSWEPIKSVVGDEGFEPPALCV